MTISLYIIGVFLIICGLFLNKRKKRKLTQRVIDPVFYAIKPDRKLTSQEFQEFIKVLNEDYLLEILKGLKIIKENASIQEIDVREDYKKINNFFISKIPGRYYVSQNIDYHGIVKWIAIERGVANQIISRSSTFEIEREIFKCVFDSLWENLSREKRIELVKKLDDKKSNKELIRISSQKGAVAVSILSATVNISGFAFYTTMSSLIFNGASLLGITLPFTIYTSASTTVSVLAGPIGLLSAGVLIILTFFMKKKKERKSIESAIILIHLVKVNILEKYGYFNKNNITSGSTYTANSIEIRHVD